uniref:RRM domain-containing protein n=1 Tax=Panagrellus redivivus TaxID=6233 RepID=A0A7E4W7N9_PANRE
MTNRPSRHQAFHQAPISRYGPVLPPAPFIITTTTAVAGPNHPSFCPHPTRFVQIAPPLASSSRPPMSGPAPPGLWPPFATRLAPGYPRPMTMNSFSDPDVGRARTVIFAQPLRCGPCREQLVYQVMGKYGPVYRCFPMPATEDSASVSPSAVAVIYYNPSDAHRALNCFPSDRFLFGLTETTVNVPTVTQMSLLCWQLRYVDPGLLMAGIPEVLPPQPVPSFWFPESPFVYSSAFVQPIPQPHPQHHTTKIVFGPPVTSPMATPAATNSTPTALPSPSCPATNTSPQSSPCSSASPPTIIDVDPLASSPSNSTTSTTSSSSSSSDSIHFDEGNLRPGEDSSISHDTPTMPTTFLRRGSLRESLPKKMSPVFDDGFEDADNTYSSSSGSSGSSLLSPNSPSSEESGITSGYGSENEHKKSQEDEQQLIDEALSPPSERTVVVTQEDVLKRFLDSKAKPRKPAFCSSPRKRLPSIYDGKNIVNGIHLPKHAMHLFAKNNQIPTSVAVTAPPEETKPIALIAVSVEDDSISKYVKELTRAPPPNPGAIALREEHNRLLRSLDFGHATTTRRTEKDATTSRLLAACHDNTLRELAELVEGGSFR